MLITLFLALSLPKPPEAVAELTFADPDGSFTVVVRRDQCWADKGLPGDANPLLQQDPIHTGMVPKLQKQSGSVTCLWTGYRPGTHETPGDTLLSYALLIEGRPADHSIQGVWYEDHREVPRTWYRATGALNQAQLTLSLTSIDGAPPATLTGIVASPR